MGIKLKPLSEQIIVITGASSGIGLATVQLAAERGARLVLASRSLATLEEIAESIIDAGGEAIAVEADVADKEQLERVAQAAIEKFGRIDTWINNAGVSIYGRLDQVSDEDSRRLFDTNFWGVVNGSLVALPHLRRNGGALINTGSEVSEAVIPLQAMYSASKHAVKGFTDGLRIEIEEVDKAPVSITLIQPTAVDTPYPQHAKNYMTMEPKLPTPRIAPEQVAEAILDAATTPRRDVKVGTMAKVNTTIAKLLPTLGDKFSAKQVSRQQYNQRPRNPAGALFQPSEQSQVVGQTRGLGGNEK